MADSQIHIKRIGRAMTRIRVEGTAPLIVNKFSSKARQMMLDKQQGRAVVREPKNPEALFEASLHRLPGDRYGFPATGFKDAIVKGARHFKGSKITMEALKTTLLVVGEGVDMLVEIAGSQPKMREDAARNETGVADIRFRAEFWPWTADLQIIYVPTTLTLESVVALVDAGGMSGVGEWRPASKKSYSGMYGTWKVVDDQDISQVLL
jgi:hypothetical protein